MLIAKWTPESAKTLSILRLISKTDYGKHIRKNNEKGWKEETIK